jgi:hypothetical protein
MDLELQQPEIISDFRSINDAISILYYTALGYDPYWNHDFRISNRTAALAYAKKKPIWVTITLHLNASFVQ